MQNNQLNVITQDRYLLMKTPAEQKMLLLMDSAKAIHTDLTSYGDLVSILHHYTYGKVTEEQEQDLTVQARDLKEEIKKHFPAISFEEVKIALNNTIRKAYGDFYGLNIVTYHNGIKSYLNAAETLNAKRAVLARLNPPHTVEATPIEKEQICQQGFERLKAKVAAGESILEDAFTTGCYDWLKKKGTLNGIMTPDEIEETKQRATDLLNAEFTTKANTLNADVRKTNLKKAQDLIGGLLPNDLNAMCKKLALETLIKTGRI